MVRVSNGFFKGFVFAIIPSLLLWALIIRLGVAVYRHMIGP